MSVLGKRYAAEISSQMEASLTEYYRQECLRSLYKKQVRRDLWEFPLQRRAASPHHRHNQQQKKQMAARRHRHKGVSFALAPEIIGSADPTVDRSPIDVSPISQLELLLLLSQRTFPSAANTVVAA